MALLHDTRPAVVSYPLSSRIERLIACLTRAYEPAACASTISYIFLQLRRVLLSIVPLLSGSEAYMAVLQLQILYNIPRS